MSVVVQVEPSELRRRAEVHAQAIDQIKAARADNERMTTEAQTLGPLYHQVKASISEVAAKRDAALASEQDRHEKMRDALLASAADYERIEAENHARLTISPSDT
ncbi:ESX-1 secretion-associated protein [Mycolicibacterium sphagni]|uniref:ESX-1 secretion-associated protein n=1 Tax=Mycolicibacterium sphagni TaxID=1786 RepID=A0ABX2K616_9MYCO|nr:ESX-1 secretion-associated protein [Mycolicibacterium sphagni]